MRPYCWPISSHITRVHIHKYYLLHIYIHTYMCMSVDHRGWLSSVIICITLHNYDCNIELFEFIYYVIIFYVPNYLVAETEYK